MENLQSTPSSFTTTTSQKNYDVFLNFRGEDTRRCFTCHLHKALQEKIETFIDDGAPKGKHIWPTLKAAIEQSEISVVIFSKDYASSKWCLRELVEIMEWENKHIQIVIPVFYVVEPTNVRYQTGSFEDSFDKYGNKSQGEVQKWRKALIEASNLFGFDSSKFKDDSTLIDQIVDYIWTKLKSEYPPHDIEGLIGHKRIKRVISSLCLDDRTNVQIIGIWGMGGIGKTYIADAIFKNILNQFKGVCFIENVRERLQNSAGLVSLQEEILSKVFKDENLKLNGPIIPSKIEDRLNRTRVLIVLDNVDNVEKLARGFDQLGLGSRVIIASRDKHVLQLCGVNDKKIFEVKGFDDHDALQLFRNCAFKKNYPPEDFTVLSNELVKYSKGNPLALTVLGLSLYQQSKQAWESVVNTLQTTNLDHYIFNVLKISYDGLEKDSQKDIFLGIACFFKGETRDYVEKIIGGDCCYSLDVLINKSLITISSYGKGSIQMHDLLVEMGREIVDKESPNTLGKRRWLWRQREVQNTLKNDEGTDAVQGIVLDLLNIKDMQLSPQAFKKMYNLRFLKFYDSSISGSESPGYFPKNKKQYGIDFSYNSKVHFPKGPSDFSDELRSLVWIGFPLTELPSNFNPENIVELNLRYSNLERLWDGAMPAPNLKLLILRECKHLTDIPNLSYSPLLERIDLGHCQSLLDFPPLAPHLEYLHFLDLHGCKSLRSFPSDIHFESLTSLVLCDCDNLTKFPEISGNLRCLYLCGTAIDEVPPSIGSLTKLFDLNLSKCTRLKHISTNICKLKYLNKLNLKNCSELEIFPEICEAMEGLETLDLSGTAIKELPDNLGNLTSLNYLSCHGCRGLRFRCRGLRFIHSSYFPCSLTNLYLSNCNLKEIPEDICHLSSLLVLHLSGNDFESLPKSMKQLSNLDTLEVNNCNSLRSLTELPLRLRVLSAIDCKKLRSILLDASELVEAHFMFTNCPNLEETAVGKILATVERYEGEFDFLSFCCPGSEVPGWFSYKSNESSIKFRMAYNDLLQGFILCAVIEFEEYRFNATYEDENEDEDELFVKCRFSNDGGRYYLSTGVSSCTLITKSGIGTLIDSDHVALWYFKALGHQVLESEFTNCSFDIWLSDHSPKCRVKSWGVRPITKKPNEDHKEKYAELIKIFGVTIEDIGETSRKRSRTSYDHREEEVEPHLKITIPDEVSDEDSDEDNKVIYAELIEDIWCHHLRYWGNKRKEKLYI